MEGVGASTHSATRRATPNQQSKDRRDGTIPSGPFYVHFCRGRLSIYQDHVRDLLRLTQL
jgi:hypothetical protein